MNLTKRLSKVGGILNKKKKTPKNKQLTLDCSAASSTESLLAQLEEAEHESITHLTLSDSLQRPDNVRVFNALSNLVTSKSACRTALRQVRLVEPRIQAADYRRWCFKKTNFLRHAYKDCQDSDIEVKIQGTLLLETPEDKPQDVSSWVLEHFPKTILQDRDIKSLFISLRDVKPSQDSNNNRKRNADVERVFQSLIDLFNNDNRHWDFVHLNVLYATVPKYAAPQTEALLEVAHIYDIPLQVQWKPLDDSKKAHGTWTRMSRAFESKMPTVVGAKKEKAIIPTNPPRGGGGGKAAPIHSVEDTTASTVDYEGSSGALCHY